MDSDRTCADNYYRKGKFRRIPVVDHENKLVGLITLDDILMLLSEEFSQIGRLLKCETPRAVVEEQEFSLTGTASFPRDSRLSVEIRCFQQVARKYIVSSPDYRCSKRSYILWPNSHKPRGRI